VEKSGHPIVDIIAPKEFDGDLIQLRSNEIALGFQGQGMLLSQNSAAANNGFAKHLPSISCDSFCLENQSLSISSPLHILCLTFLRRPPCISRPPRFHQKVAQSLNKAKYINI
jgi:hypothetical protein